MFFPNFAVQTVIVAQLVRASDCGSEGRGFEPHQSPLHPGAACWSGIFYIVLFLYFVA